MMSDQMNFGTLDEIMAAGGLGTGSDVGEDYDPFAQSLDLREETKLDQVDSPSNANQDDSEQTGRAKITVFPVETPSLPPKQATANVQSEIKMPAKAAASNVAAPDFNPLATAVNKAEEQNVKAGAASILAKPPVFTYGSATEDITDKMLTFEQLRIDKATDFPELEDGKKVTWTMEYGTITKQVPKPKETVIHKLKEEMETSKEFLEQLKKLKDKPKALICKVKPRIIAQSKGKVAAYKGVFTSLEEAEQSDKAIKLVPSSDGKVYEIRCTEAGQFIVPVTDVPELSEVSAGFFPALPPVPYSLLCQVIGFFRHFMENGQELEAMVHLYWDKLREEYHIAVPRQQVTKAHIDAMIPIENVLDEERYLCFADIHSHNSMPAKFSDTDDRDECATRVYLVIGRLQQYFPEISVRISCGGRFWPIALSSIVEGIPSDFPTHWAEHVEYEASPHKRWFRMFRKGESLL